MQARKIWQVYDFEELLPHMDVINILRVQHERPKRK